MILVLIAAAIISGYVGEPADELVLADLRLFEVAQFELNKAALTDESQLAWSGLVRRTGRKSRDAETITSR